MNNIFDDFINDLFIKFKGDRLMNNFTLYQPVFLCDVFDAEKLPGERVEGSKKTILSGIVMNPEIFISSQTTSPLLLVYIPTLFRSMYFDVNTIYETAEEALNAALDTSND